MKEVLLEIIKEAGLHIKDKFYTDFEVSSKEGINNLVTEVDKSTEKLIRKRIEETYPEHAILGEEYGGQETRQKGFVWIVDPIDGTVNYAQRIPICCVSIGIMLDGIMKYGAVYNPMMDELFYAEKDKGAFLNGKKIKVSEPRPFKRSCLVTGFPYKHPQKVDIIAIFSKIAAMGVPIRRLGSAALDLCWLACGRFDGFWEFGLNPWDVAAGYLIVKEAGGKVSGFQHENMDVFSKETLASNGHIHQELKEIINNFINEQK